MSNNVTTTNNNPAEQGGAVQAVNPQANISSFMMGLQELKTRANMVSQIKQQIMRPDVHFGVIPGCGNKPTLLKNGAELLCMAFKLASDAKVDISDLGGGHREYTVTTTLTVIGTGEPIATGLGSCSTMESKYRYRGNEMEPTGKPVPREYWDAKRANDSADMKRILGGYGYVAKKDEAGSWMIFKKGDKKTENPDIADTYNTVLKMASKRSLIDAVLKATGGSCEFTQDLEDMKGNAAAQAAYEPEYSVMDEQPSAPQQPAPQPQQQKKKAPVSLFRAELDAMKAADPDAFEKVRKLMNDEGWKTPLDVPEDRYQQVRDWFNMAVGNV